MEKGHTRLNNTRDCRKFLARLINQTSNGDMTPDFLRAMTYSLKTLVGILNDSDLEQRILLLEENILHGKVNNARQIKGRF
jgi:hypothetical protein